MTLKIAAGRRMALGDNVINIVFYILVGYIVFILPNSVGTPQNAAKLINVIMFAVSAVELVRTRIADAGPLVAGGRRPASIRK